MSACSRRLVQEGLGLLGLLGRVVGLWFGYIKTQLLESLIVGGLTWAVSSALGLSWAFPLGVLAGILELVPGLGPIVTLVPAAVIALWRGSTIWPVENWLLALIVVAAYIAIQQVDNLLIHPHLMGQRFDLPPLLVLGAILFGAAVAGVVGAYLAVPVLITLREIIVHIRSRLRQEPEPPPL